MSTKKVPIEGLAGAVDEILAQYNKAIVGETKKEAEASMKKLVQETKANAPVDKGKYKAHISSKTLRESATGIVKVWYVKAPSYRLAHLLEFGHALRGGGRASARPHIAPACATVLPEYERKVKEAIERAGN